MPDKHGDDGFGEYKRLILDRIETNTHRLNKIQEDVTYIKTEIATLKVKASIWGAAAGLFAAVLSVVAKMLLGGHP